MMYGRGEHTKSIRVVGRTGMNTCYRGGRGGEGRRGEERRGRV